MIPISESTIIPVANMAITTGIYLFIYDETEPLVKSNWSSTSIGYLPLNCFRKESLNAMNAPNVAMIPPIYEIFIGK